MWSPPCHRAELQHTSEVPCSSCNESKRKLESMAAVLDRGGPGKHGELVVENLGLQRKVGTVIGEWRQCLSLLSPCVAV